MNLDPDHFFRAANRLISKAFGHVVSGDKCPVRKLGKRKVRQ